MSFHLRAACLWKQDTGQKAHLVRCGGLIYDGTGPTPSPCYKRHGSLQPISTSHPVSHKDWLSPEHMIQSGPTQSLLGSSADFWEVESLPSAWVAKTREGLLKAGPKQRQSPERRRKKLSLILWIPSTLFSSMNGEFLFLFK